jgi:drug/metabolite transporter superfamily protein YnfA
MSFLSEFWQFLRVRKKLWLLPLFVMLLVFGVLLIATQSSALAPFIYTLI